MCDSENKKHCSDQVRWLLISPPSLLMLGLTREEPQLIKMVLNSPRAKTTAWLVPSWLGILWQVPSAACHHPGRGTLRRCREEPFLPWAVATGAYSLWTQRLGFFQCGTTWGRSQTSPLTQWIRGYWKGGQSLPFYQNLLPTLIPTASWAPLLWAPILCLFPLPTGSKFNRHLLNSNYFPGCVLGTWATTVNRTNKKFKNPYILCRIPTFYWVGVQERGRKIINAMN